MRPEILKFLTVFSVAACGYSATISVAQQVFRIVGPDGRVTFSDKPPATPDAKSAAVVPGARRDGASGNAALPFELRSVVAKYPVTLYTAASCGPCTAGRSMLQSRGIPFSERTVTTQEDADALQRLAGENALPLLTIGSQKLKGFSDADWGQYLDVAGYPQSSRLPAGFRNPPPAPLVVVQRQEPATAQAAEQATAAPIPVAVPRPETPNPAGIRF
ncbi:MAG: hypothetical protein RLZZ126_1285 [Pseudomonadota bacterium]|jgi:glutaredoxin